MTAGPPPSPTPACACGVIAGGRYLPEIPSPPAWMVTRIVHPSPHGWGAGRLPTNPERQAGPDQRQEPGQEKGQRGVAEAVLSRSADGW